jgi:RNA polymerase II elongation factor ELL
LIIIFYTDSASSPPPSLYSDAPVNLNQTLVYGSKSHRLTPPPDSYPYDLYLTQPYESTREAMRIHHTQSIFIKPKVQAPLAGAESSRNGADDSTIVSKAKPAASNKSSTSSGLDSDLETLQNGLAAHDASRERYVPPKVALVCYLTYLVVGHA